MPRQRTNPYFDHRVGTGDQSGWYFEAKRFCRLEVDHQFEASFLETRHVAWIGAKQNLNDLHSVPAKRTFEIV
jgi:hypothetical protein